MVVGCATLGARMTRVRNGAAMLLAQSQVKKAGVEWRARSLNQKGSFKGIAKCMKEPERSYNPSKRGQGPDQGSVSEGQRAARAMWHDRFLRVWTSAETMWAIRGAPAVSFGVR